MGLRPLLVFFPPMHGGLARAWFRVYPLAMNGVVGGSCPGPTTTLPSSIQTTRTGECATDVAEWLAERG